MNKKITLIVPGSVAAVRTAEIASGLVASGLVASGFGVDTVVTETLMRWGPPKWGQPFVDNVAQASQGTVLVSGRSPEAQDALMRQADRIVICPATADMLSQVAYASPDSSPLIKALADRPERLVVIPAMNAKMWAHPAVQRNCATLLGRGAVIVGPAKGNAEAKTEFERAYPGYGRIPDTDRIVQAVNGVFAGTGDILSDYEAARAAACGRWKALQQMPRAIAKKSVLALIGGTAHWQGLRSFHDAVTSIGYAPAYILGGQAREFLDPLKELAGEAVYSRMSTGREHIRLTEAAGCVVLPFPDNAQLERMRKGSARSLGDSAYLAALVSDAPVIIGPRQLVALDTALVRVLREDGVRIVPEKTGFTNLRKVLTGVPRL